MLRIIRRHLAPRRLKRSLKPCPEYRTRRLAQFGPDRRERYRRNVEAIGL